jgi:hypothetical protein
MVESFVVCIMLVCVMCDAYRDKRLSHKGYYSWHKQYKQFKPIFLWRKFQNRWHIAKQISFILPHIIVLCWVAQESWTLAIIYVCASPVLWSLPKPPDHWND